MRDWATRPVAFYLGALLFAGLTSVWVPTFACYVAGFATAIALVKLAANFCFAHVLEVPKAPRLSAVAFVTKRLRESDPDFDPAAFLDRVRLAALKLLEAWASESVASVAHFVSDGLYERLRFELAEKSATDIRQELQDVRVRRVGMASLSSRGRFDVLSVAIDLDGVLLTRWRGDDSEVEPGPIEASGLCGFWTFLRRRGAKTRDASGLLEGTCPNCGSSVPLDQSARCSACRSVLKGGRHDWVLCAITGGRDWKLIPSSRAPGIADYEYRDRGFSVQHLEDRAAVLFWRVLASGRSGAVERLRSCTTQALCERLAASPPSDWAGIQLRAVEARGVRRGEDLDTAVVELRWSARRSSGARRNAVLAPGSTLFELARRAGVPSPDGLDLTSAHCPACGAPDDGQGGAACSFCGAFLNDGSHSWLLAGICAQRSREGRRLLARIRGARRGSS